MNAHKPTKPRSSTVETLASAPKSKSRLKPKILIPLVCLLLIISLASGTYAIKSDKNNELNSQTALPQPNTQNAGTAITAEPAEEKQVVSQPEKPLRPIVVFEPDGVFSEEEKQELKDKLIDPMVDYRPDAYAALIIEIYSQDKFVGGAGDDKYIVTTLSREDGGEHGGFLYGSKKKGLDYWVPECLETCQFSEEFQKKHPEVIKEYQR